MASGFSFRYRFSKTQNCYVSLKKTSIFPKTFSFPAVPENIAKKRKDVIKSALLSYKKCAIIESKDFYLFNKRNQFGGDAFLKKTEKISVSPFYAKLILTIGLLICVPMLIVQILLFFSSYKALNEQNSR